MFIFFTFIILYLRAKFIIKIAIKFYSLISYCKTWGLKVILNHYKLIMVIFIIYYKYLSNCFFAVPTPKNKAFLKTDEQFYYKSPNQVLEAYEEVKRRITPKVNDFFSVVPKSDYILRSYPEAQAKSAPGASYIPASSDGTRPGVFFANTYNLKGQPKYGIESLSIHEAVPGHHFQLSLQNEVKGLPKIRTQNFYTVYAEGWALYAESLGKELGMFSDPYQYYGKLDAELFRAMRLVVDTGIHDKGWTQQQAIDYMFNNSTLAKTDIIAEVERYMVWPGQALAYKVGQLKIQSLRLFAEQSLGSKFNIKQFHNLILLDGPLPMPLLEKKIKDWVKHISDLKVEV